MKTSIETIGGKLCTVVRWPFAEREAWVRQQLAMGMPVAIENKHGRRIVLLDQYVDEYYYIEIDGIERCCSKANFTNVIAVLPALPKDVSKASLDAMHAYQGVGLFPFGGKNGVTHATDGYGNRHEIAMEGEHEAI